jgi:KUP system potassium uptake protein
VSRVEVIGLISLMIWTLTIIVTLKYVLFLLRADNDGEGGTLSLAGAAHEDSAPPATVLFLMGAQARHSFSAMP